MGKSDQKRALLINMSPDRCRALLNGSVSMEAVLREVRLDTPFKVYICCSKNLPKGQQPLVLYSEDKMFSANGRVVAECVCDTMFPIKVFEDNGAIQDWNFHELSRTGYEYDALSEKILKSKAQQGWALSLSDVKQYVRPRDVYVLGCNSVTHGWCYARERDWSRYWRDGD